MLDELRVKDVFVKIEDYPNISQHAPIGYAIDMMHRVLEDKNKYRTILVIDDDEHLRGYLTLRDLIRAIGPEYLHKKRPDVKGHQPFNFEGLGQDLTSLSLLWQEGFTLKLHGELKKPVKEYMTLMQDQVTLMLPSQNVSILCWFMMGLMIDVVIVLGMQVNG